MSEKSSKQPKVDQALGVWTVDDEYWFIAATREQAMELASSLSGIEIEDIIVCRRLSVEELNGITFYDDLEYQNCGRSMLAQVGKLVIEGEWEPGVFAASEA